MLDTTKKRIAVFDIDGTFFRSSLLIEYNKALVSAGYIPRRAVRQLLPEYFAWRDRKREYNDYLHRVIEMHAAEIKGKSAKDAKVIARRVFNNHKDRVYRYTRDELARLQKTHYTVAISGSPLEMVALFARYYKFDEYFATVYEIDRQGNYTGLIADRRTIGMKGPIVEHLVEDKQLTLRGSWGFGDTGNDVSFLQLVENPVVVNPSSDLYQVARRRKWSVVVERKDMVYEL